MVQTQSQEVALAAKGTKAIRKVTEDVARQSNVLEDMIDSFGRVPQDPVTLPFSDQTLHDLVDAMEGSDAAAQLPLARRLAVLKAMDYLDVKPELVDPLVESLKLGREAGWQDATADQLAAISDDVLRMVMPDAQMQGAEA